MHGSRLSPFILACSIIGLAFLQATSGQEIKKEIDVGYANIETIRPILKRTLSPRGRFVMLPSKGAVLVIDQFENVAAAENALAQAPLPNPNVNVNFAFQTGIRPRRSQISVGREIYFPTAYDPPRIPNQVFGNGPIIITPAHPTGFTKRHIGVKSDTITSLNPDGSINVDVNFEQTEFEGFINYGSAILPAGAIGTVPVNGQVTNPGFFQPLIPNNILLPIISTTTISTSVVIRPRVAHGKVNVDMIPRFTVHSEGQEEGVDKVDVDLKQYLTTVKVANNGLGRISGFKGASAEFNRHFMGAKQLDAPGGTTITIKAKVSPGKVDPSPANTTATTKE